MIFPICFPSFSFFQKPLETQYNQNKVKAIPYRKRDSPKRNSSILRKNRIQSVTVKLFHIFWKERNDFQNDNLEQ